jgi:hypothetical protein
VYVIRPLNIAYQAAHGKHAPPLGPIVNQPNHGSCATTISNAATGAIRCAYSSEKHEQLLSTLQNA